MNILYVEDDPRDADLTRREFAKSAPRFRLDTVATQREALARLEGEPGYDLVLTDLRLPDGDGLAVLAHIRERGLPLAVVVITGRGDEESAVAALKAGADDYVVKGGDYLARLPLALEDALGRFRAEAARRAHPLRVFYAEHSATDVDLTRRHLARHAPHIHLEVVHSAPEIFQRLSEKDRYDLLLLDYQLPGMNGLEVLKELAQSPGFDLPVVMVTGMGSEEVAVQTLKLGAADYLVKNAGYLYQLPSVLENAFHRAQLAREQAALRESETRYRGIFDGVQDAIFVESTSGEILDVNARACEMYGYPRDVFLTKTVTDLVPPEHFAPITDELPELGRSDQPIETVNIRASGEQFPVEITGQLQTIGGETMLLVVVRDITVRKRTEEERERLLAQIQEQAQRVQQIIDTVPEGVLLLDTAGRVMLANRMGKKSLVALADARVEDTLTRLGDRSLAELLTSPLTKGLWHEVTTDDRHFEVIARPLDTELESEDWVLVIRDVTQEREVQRQVQRQERLAAVGQLAGGIAHDFNNLLTTIILYAQIALGKSEHDLPPNVTRAFKTILSESRQAAKLVQQILDFSRRTPIKTSPVDLKPFIKEAVRVLERTILESIHLQFDAGPEEYVVEADPTRIQQVLMNLVLNARDAMPEGGDLRIDLSRVEISPGEKVPVMEMVPGEWVCLAVSDTGMGIPPDVLFHLFEPFFTTKEPGKGTGLGLAQVHGIVAQHDGHIGVETEVGKGTTFRVYLSAFEAEVEVTKEQVSALPQGQGETILLVEDDENLRKGGQELLNSLGYRVLTGANGREALEVYRSLEKVDLVITDVVMPEMGGKTLLRKLKETAPGLRVLAVTGYVMEEDVQELREAGFLDIVHKPFDADRIAQVVRRALDVD